MSNVAYVLPYRYLDGEGTRLLDTTEAVLPHLRFGDQLVISDQSDLAMGYAHQAKGRATSFIWTPKPEWNRGLAINLGVIVGMAAGCEWACVMSLDLILPEDFGRKIHELIDGGQHCFNLFEVYQGDGRHFGAENWGGDIALFCMHSWREVGGFPEFYQGYGYEDKDFYFRIRRAGIEPYQTGIRIDHKPHEQCPRIHESLAANEALFREAWEGDNADTDANV